MKYIIPLLFLAFLFVQCNTSSSGNKLSKKAVKNSKLAAKDLCACTAKLGDLFERINTANKANDSKALEQISKELFEVQPEIAACVETLDKKYVDYNDDEAFKKRMEEEFSKACPEVYQLMSDADN